MSTQNRQCQHKLAAKSQIDNNEYRREIRASKPKYQELRDSARLPTSTDQTLIHYDQIESTNTMETIISLHRIQHDTHKDS